MKAPSSYPNPLLRGLRLPAGVIAPTWWYRLWRLLCRIVMIPIWKIRVFNRCFEPASGGAVYICNHQSFLDPMLMSFALARPMNFMARDTLFRFPPFGRFIASFNAFPVRRATADLAALKEAMRRLKAGGQVIVFAEGTRTRDGTIGPFLPGVAMLSQRAAEWTVPVVIEGAFEAWPRTRLLPGRGQITVRYGRPIHQSEARKHSPEEFVNLVRSRMVEIQADMRKRLGKPQFKNRQQIDVDTGGDGR